LSPETAPPVIGKRPDWLKVPLSHGPHFKELKRLMREQQLHTICEEAACPNIGECWGEFRTASFLLLGDTCTRNCGFCDVTTGRPGSVDWGEPLRLAEAVTRLQLRHVVITSVTRDDLDDGGAAIFAATIRQLKKRDPALGVEVLIPDFQGNWDALDVLTVGQYLRPSLRHLPVERHVPPAEFDELRTIARDMGFRHVESGPLVRSSYHAHAQLQ